jgi:hypothetical protein
MSACYIRRMTTIEVKQLHGSKKILIGSDTIVFYETMQNQGIVIGVGEKVKACKIGEVIYCGEKSAVFLPAYFHRENGNMFMPCKSIREHNILAVCEVQDL